MDISRKNHLIEKTLAWCNSVREEKGLEPLSELPKGKPYNPKSCPCGQATGLWVEKRRAFTQEPIVATNSIYLHSDLPKEVIEFIAEFDSYNIPELVSAEE